MLLAHFSINFSATYLLKDVLLLYHAFLLDDALSGKNVQMTLHLQLSSYFLQPSVENVLNEHLNALVLALHIHVATTLQGLIYFPISHVMKKEINQTLINIR